MGLPFAQVPFLAGLMGYKPAWLANDVSAGLAVAAVGLPSAIAYPAIAGLPPETGLYASIAPLVAYALFGPSRKLIVGPDAATMTVLAAVLTTMYAAPNMTHDRAALAALLALMVGAMCLVARMVRLGVLANFLSRPILTGFFFGIALSILIGQIGRFTGLKIEADGLIAPVLELIRKADSIQWPSLVLALACFALLQVLRIIRFPIPGPLVVVALSVALSAIFDFQHHGIAVVGDIPGGFPPLSLPSTNGLSLQPLILGSAAIFLVSFGAGIIAARSFGAREGYEVEPNRELTGFGASNIAAGLFSGFPISASDSRTAVNLLVGGRTQIASLVVAGALLATVLFLGGVLKILPVPALGAILAATALSLMDVGSLVQIWRISRIEFLFALIALWGPIGWGVLYGVVIAMAATLVYMLQQSMHPHDALLGRAPGRAGFFKLHHVHDAKPVPGLAIYLVQDNLLFYNVDYVHRRMREIVTRLPSDTRWFVLDASAVPHIDSSATGMLEEFQAELKKRGIKLGIAEVHAEARAMLKRAGLIDEIGPAMVFEGIEDALRAFEASSTGVPTEAPAA